MAERIEVALRDLAVSMVFPDTPDLGDQVLERIREPSQAPRIRRMWWVAVAAVIVALLAVLLPGPRQAIADLLGIGAVKLTIVDELPSAATVAEPSGSSATLDAARDSVDFSIAVPSVPPDIVMLDTSVAGGMVTLGYRPEGQTYALLITQLQAQTDAGAVGKLVSPETTITPVTVAEEHGFWIEGEPHVIVLFDADGVAIQDTARLAGNTLLYQRQGVTIRIEGVLDLEQALEIAADLS